MLGNSACAGEDVKISPLLTAEVLQDVLTEICVPHVTCDFEADEELVALANEWDCPVLSDDSDFFIFYCKGGFIPLRSVRLGIDMMRLENLEADESRLKYINTSIYYLSTMSKHFGINPSCVVFIVLLNGNDVVSPICFKRRLCDDKPCCK